MDNPAIFIDEVQSFTNTSTIPLNTQIDTLRSATNPTGTPLSTLITNLDTKINTINNTVAGISSVKQSFSQSFGSSGYNISNFPNSSTLGTVGLSFNSSAGTQPSYLIVTFQGGKTININKCFINLEVYLYSGASTSTAFPVKLFLINTFSNSIWLGAPYTIPYVSSSNSFIAGSIQVIEFN